MIMDEATGGTELPPNIEVVETPTSPVPVVETPPAGTGSATPPAWVQPRIDTLTREKFEEKRQRELAEARAAAAEAALEELRRGAVAPPGTPPVAPPAPGTKMITLEEAERLAEMKSANQRFADKTTEIYNSGKTKFKDDFDTSLRGLQNVGFGQNLASRSLVEAAIETGSPDEVLHELGKDLTTAGQVLQLNPTQMGVRLAAIAQKLKEKPKVSNLSEPVPTRVGGTGATTAGSLYETDKLSIDEWMAKRNKEARKKRR